MTTSFLMSEGCYVDDAGHLILSTYVDLRAPSERSPITTLVKGCSEQYAIELYKRIRISKPALFRRHGENLVRDPSEAQVSRTKLLRETINDPDDLAEAQSINDEIVRGSELLQTSMKLARDVKSVRRSRTTTSSASFGKNGWIFCTSIEPMDWEEKDRWHQSMPDEYDHMSYIHRPREFARALGSMVAEQLGPQGTETELTHSFDGRIKLRTRHKFQMIYHGPVVYVDDPYEVVFNAPQGIDYMLRTIFVKRTEYSDQREYRFVIWTEQEPTTETVDLDVSPAMLGAMQERRGEYKRHVLPAVILTSESSDSESMPIEHEDDLVAEGDGEISGFLPDPRALGFVLGDPSIPVAPHSYGVEDLPSDLHEATTTYSALKTLRQVIGGPTGSGRLAGKRNVEAASSAWHAEPCIRHLCSMFDDPIENISISEDNFVIITIKFPEESTSKARMTFGPRGTGACVIEADGRQILAESETAWSMGGSIGENLEKAGLHVRRDSSALDQGSGCDQV